MDNLITLRNILEYVLEAGESRKSVTDREELLTEGIALVKQKLIQMRRPLSDAVDKKRDVFNSQIATDVIIDTLYTELDTFCEGIDEERKDLLERSKNDPQIDNQRPNTF